MPLVEPHQFKLDHGVIITCAQPIDGNRFAEILADFIHEVDHWKDDPESEDLRPQRTPFTKAEESRLLLAIRLLSSHKTIRLKRLDPAGTSRMER